MTALIVDDRKEIADVIGELFRARGVFVNTAYSHSDAIALFNNTYDLVFTDKNLDNGNRGENLISEYQKINKKCEFFIYTGDTLSESERINGKIKSYDNINITIDDLIQKVKRKAKKMQDDTNTIEPSGCVFHSGICVNVKRGAQDIQTLFDMHTDVLKSLKETNDAFNGKFTKLQGMFITAMGFILLMCGTWILNNLHIHF